MIFPWDEHLITCKCNNYKWMFEKGSTICTFCGINFRFHWAKLFGLSPEKIRGLEITTLLSRDGEGIMGSMWIIK